MLILERWDFPYLFIARDRVSDHATHRRNPHRLHLDLVPVSSLHADGIYCLAPPSRCLSTECLAPEAPAVRSPPVGLALAPVAGLATGAGVRPAPYRHRLAEETVPGLLATSQPTRETGAPRHFQRSPRAHPRYVA